MFLFFLHDLTFSSILFDKMEPTADTTVDRKELKLSEVVKDTHSNVLPQLLENVVPTYSKRF